MSAVAPSGETKLPIQHSNRRWPGWLWIALALPCLAARTGPALPADGLTFVVNATADDPDAIVGDGLCETSPGNGVCTLRAAIEEANAQPTDDAISFDIPVTDPGYNGTFWTISLLSALPDLSTNLAIEGSGPGLLVVTRSSTSLFRIFHVTNTGTVTVSGLTLSNGHPDGENGGGILNDKGGVTNVLNCILSSNQASRGGGISNQSTSTTNVIDTIVTGNTAAEQGGGITNQDTGTVNVSNSTVENNDGPDGAGIRQSDVGVTTVVNSTIWGNFHAGLGAVGGNGIYNASGGILSVSNCTVSANLGTGLTNQASGPFLVKSSIVAQNGGPARGDIDDVAGSFISDGFNVIGVGSGSTSFTQDTDQTGIYSPGLDPSGPQDHGGPTLTVALLPLSPAIDKGTSAGLTGSLTTDQRDMGFARTFDDPAVPNATGGDGTDVGAFEAQTAFPTPTPTPTPSPAIFGNISTRLNVGTGDNVLIGGFIITGSQPKPVLIRAIGPSLPLSGSLGDPVLQLFDSAANLISDNDNWRDSPNAQDIIDSGIPPTDDNESAILRVLDPGEYTAIVSGANNTTGIALVEAYDLDPTVDSKLANISSRGLVQGGDNVMIGGIILLGEDPTNVLLRAIGLSLPLSGTLSDPTLELHDANGDLIVSNDNWKDTQQAEIEATGIPPTSDAESAIFISLVPGDYTMIVQGKNGSTGIALVEAYQLNP